MAALPSVFLPLLEQSRRLRKCCEDYENSICPKSMSANSNSPTNRGVIFKFGTEYEYILIWIVQCLKPFKNQTHFFFSCQDYRFIYFSFTLTRRQLVICGVVVAYLLVSLAGFCTIYCNIFNIQNNTVILNSKIVYFSVIWLFSSFSDNQIFFAFWSYQVAKGDRFGSTVYL